MFENSLSIVSKRYEFSTELYPSQKWCKNELSYMELEHLKYNIRVTVEMIKAISIILPIRRIILRQTEIVDVVFLHLNITKVTTITQLGQEREAYSQ